MKNLHANNRDGRKKGLLAVAVSILMLTRQSLVESYGAFEMLEEEYEIPPYGTVNVDNLTGYQLAGFKKVDSTGRILEQGVLAFTLLDVVYTDSLLFCEKEDCCEARNYSYDLSSSSSIDSEIVFPPCEMDELLADLKSNCSIVPSDQPLNQTLLQDVLRQKISTICSYYTLYNQSNVSSTLVQCIKDVFDQRWGAYCGESDLLKILTIFAAATCLSLCSAVTAFLFCERWQRSGKKIVSRKPFFVFIACMLIVSELFDIGYTTGGLAYAGYGSLFEQGLVEGPLSESTTGRVSISVVSLLWLLRFFTIFGDVFDRQRHRIQASVLLNSVTSVARGLLRAGSMFVLTMEFSASEFRHVNSPTLAVANSALAAAIALIEYMQESKVFEGFCLMRVKLPKESCRKDYIVGLYSHLFLLLTAPLRLIICGSFLSTFSSMTIAAGSDPTMQALSYIAFFSLSYCANLLAKTNEETFGLIYETILEFMEGWAFMYVTYLKMVNQRQSVHRAMIDYYDSTDPFLFAGLFAVARVFSLFYKLSAGKFVAVLKKAVKDKQKEEIKKSRADKANEREKNIELTSDKVKEFGGFVVHQGGRQYQLVAQLTL